ncbi:MAG: DUF4407 domain-containing protein [Gammaproteobacteria bacterium]
MRNSTDPGNRLAVDSDSSNLMDRIMAIGTVERAIIAIEPKVREEIRFQFVALCLCPPAFGYSIHRVAISLLGLSTFAALGLAVVAAYGLFTLDRHYLIQARGDSSESVRKAVIKIRVLSAVVISVSFILTSTYTFRNEIDQVLAGRVELRRTQLEESQRYKQERLGARDAVDRVRRAIEHADELRARAAKREVEQLTAWQEYTDQCEGNTTGNKTRKSGCGPEARGAKRLAERLEMEIAAANRELAQLNPLASGLALAQEKLATIETRIDAEAVGSVGGPRHRVDAMIELLENSFSVGFVMIFWLLIGLIPDVLMFAAQSRMFNHEVFERMRVVQNEAIFAAIARVRQELRQQQTDILRPLDVRLVSVARQEVDFSDSIERRKAS